jgi:hypothetical protein
MQGVVATVAIVNSRTQGATPGLSFDHLFTRYHGPIYGHILGLVGDPAQAEDLTQDTFLKAYKALPGAREGAVVAWLYRIATNTARDALRHRRRLTWLPFGPGDEERLPAPVGDLTTCLATREAVRQALAHPDAARLPATTRARWPLHRRDRPRPGLVDGQREDDAIPRQGTLPRRLRGQPPGPLTVASTARRAGPCRVPGLALGAHWPEGWTARCVG